MNNNDNVPVKIQISDYLFVWISQVRGKDIVVIESYGREIRITLEECETLISVLYEILKGKRP